MNTEDQSKNSNGRNRINYDDFAKVHIRVGKILSVEDVPDADRLLKLMVDFGPSFAEASEGEEGRDVRQIISGIKEKVADPQSLVGMKTTFVVNLEPRTIKGFESNGMLFAVGEGGTFTFLLPKDDVPPGTGTK